MTRTRFACLVILAIVALVWLVETSVAHVQTPTPAPTKPLRAPTMVIEPFVMKEGNS